MHSHAESPESHEPGLTIIPAPLISTPRLGSTPQELAKTPKQSSTPRSIEDINEETLAMPRAISVAVIESIPVADLPVPKRTWRQRLGRIISLKFAISCGINTAGALITLVSGPSFYVLAGLLCICTTYANYRMTNHDLANTFREGFKALFRKHKELDADGKDDGKPADYISMRRRIFLALGIFFSTGFGLVFGALTFQSTIALTAGFGFLSAISVALPPIGIVLGAMTFICLTVVMARAFSQLAKTENIKEKLINIVKTMVCRQPGRDDNKSTARFVAERVCANLLLVALAGGVFTLVIIGQVFTLKACAVGFSGILNGLNVASVAAGTLDIISKVVAFGFGLTAQIPFILKTSCNPIIKLFTPSEVDPELLKHKTSLWVKVQTAALTIASSVSALASAAIALKGSALEAFPILGGIGAFLNTFLGNVVNALISKEDKVAPDENGASVSQSTPKILTALEFNSELNKATIYRISEGSGSEFGKPEDYHPASITIPQSTLTRSSRDMETSVSTSIADQPEEPEFSFQYSPTYG